jgi:uncharacterized membrane protein
MDTDIEKQALLVRLAYVMQWSLFVLPPLAVVSPIYLLFIRRQVTNRALRSHVDWQLMTFIMIALAIAAALALLFIGFWGADTNSPIFVFATLMLIGAAALFPAWVLYRLIRGTMRFANEAPMTALLP